MVRYCPKCRGEYQDWVEKCADCGAELVDTRPEPKFKSGEEQDIVIRGNRSYTKEPIVVIASFESTMEAELMKGILESEGIASMLVRSDAAASKAPGQYNTGAIDLLVKESEAEKAQEILNSIDKTAPEGDIPVEELPEEPGENDPKTQL